MLFKQTSGLGWQSLLSNDYPCMIPQGRHLVGSLPPPHRRDRSAQTDGRTLQVDEGIKGKGQSYYWKKEQNTRSSMAKMLNKMAQELQMIKIWDHLIFAYLKLAIWSVMDNSSIHCVQKYLSF